MTPAQERALLAAVGAGLESQAREAYDELIIRIAAGVSPRDAVQQVMGNFRADVAAILAPALSAVVGAVVTPAAALELSIAGVTLSGMLWAEAAETGAVVQGVVNRHLEGFADARRLALQLFEGYQFRDPAAEPLQINRNNPKLPQFLRDALLTSDPVQQDMAKAFARIQVDGLSNEALKAAYSELLDAIDGIKAGKGAALLEQRLETAFFERVRYFSSRIAQTEIHRAFSQRQASELMGDTDVEFVQLRRAPGRNLPCICDLFTGRDQYGLGPGVYPKAKCPLPGFHPFCRCVVAPRLDLSGKQAKQVDPEADVYFLQRLNPSVAARVMGSRAKLELVERGQSAEAVFNLTQRAQFRLRSVGQVAAERAPA